MGTKKRRATQQPQAEPPPKRVPRYLPALIVGAGLVAYFNSFQGTFVLDDFSHIWYNTKIQELSPLSKFLFHDRRPVASLSLAVNYSLSEYDLWGYHAFNLGVHLAAALVLFGVVRRTLLIQRFSTSATRAAPWLALTIALIWVVHPLQTQSVTYLIQRAEALMGLFYLLTLYCVIRGADSPWAPLWYVAAAGVCALGMASKAVMVTAPLVVLIYDRVFLSASLARAVRRRWLLYAGLACTWYVLVMVGVVRGVLSTGAKAHTATVGFGYKGVTPLEYALTQPGVILHYLKLSFWPNPLCLDYKWPVATGTAAIAVPLTVVLLLLIATAWALRRRPRLGFVGVWFFLILAPTSSFIPIKDMAFEHRMYLPLAAVVVLAVLVGHAVLAWMLRAFPPSSGPRRMVMGAVVLLVAAPLAYATISRNFTYHHRITMYTDVIRTSPHNTRAYNNLGAAYRRAGHGDLAMDAYRKALEIDPEFSSARFNVGALLEEQGKTDQSKLTEALVYYRAAAAARPEIVTRRYAVAKVLARLNRIDEAIQAYREVLALEPGHFNSRLKLASLLMQQGATAEAIEEYGRAILADPTNITARYHLGTALQEEGKVEEAVRALRGLLEVKPDHADARCDLGVCLVRLGRVEEGIRQYRQVMRQQPNHVEAHYNLGIALQGQGKFSEAEAQYREAVQADPKYANAYSNLGVVLHSQGKPEEAEAAYHQALKANPSHVPALFNLGVITYERGRPEEAVQHFQRLLRINPRHAQAREALKRALEHKQKRESR